MINELFNKVYIYGLESETDRKQSCLGQCEKHGFEAESIKSIDYRGYDKNEFGLIGAYQGINRTLINIIDDAVESNYEKILIFQDDFILDDDFESELVEAFNIIGEHWDLIYCGCVTISRTYKIKGSERLKRCFNAILDHAICVNKSLFEPFRNELMKMERTSDYCLQVILKDSMANKQDGFKYYCFDKGIAHQGEFKSSATNKIEKKKTC